MLNYAYETAFEAFSRTEDGQRVGRAPRFWEKNLAFAACWADRVQMC